MLEIEYKVHNVVRRFQNQLNVVQYPLFMYTDSLLLFYYTTVKVVYHVPPQPH